jgi:hypothetical protein
VLAKIISAARKAGVSGERMADFRLIVQPGSDYSERVAEA